MATKAQRNLHNIQAGNTKVPNFPNSQTKVMELPSQLSVSVPHQCSWHPPPPQSTPYMPPLGRRQCWSLPCDVTMHCTGADRRDSACTDTANGRHCHIGSEQSGQAIRQNMQSRRGQISTTPQCPDSPAIIRQCPSTKSGAPKCLPKPKRRRHT